MKKTILTIAFATVGNIGAMEEPELSQEFKEYLFDNQLPEWHPWREKTILDDGIHIRDNWSGSEIVMAKRFAIDKVIKTHGLTRVTLVPGYVWFDSEPAITSASDITSETRYKVFQEDQDDDDAAFKGEEANQITTILRCINMSARDIYVNENGVYLKPGDEQDHFVETWADIWHSEFTFDEQATACMEEKRKYLRAYVLKCLKQYAWENPDTTIKDKYIVRIPLLPEPDEIPLEGQERIEVLTFKSRDFEDLFCTREQKESAWKEYDEHRVEVQRWWNKDFFKGSFNQE